MSDKLALRARGKLRVTNWLPLLAVFLALSLTLSIFPSALHPSVVAGPGHQPALQQQANQGREGVAEVGVGAGSSVNPAGSIGGPATSGGGQGRGPGSGPGGIAPASLESGSTPVGAPPPTPTPTPPPGGGGGCSGRCSNSCPVGQNLVDGKCQCPTGYHLVGQQCVKDAVTCTTPGGGSGCPRIPFCYSNSLGPDSQTTEDPFSPPCVTWNRGATPGVPLLGAYQGHGVYSDHIDVVILGPGANTGTGTSFNCATPVSVGTVARTWHVLCHFFQNSFQTFGRSVVLYEYDETSAEEASPQLLAKDLYEGIFHLGGSGNPPYAVLATDDQLGTNRMSPYFAEYQIEYFEFLSNYVGTGSANGWNNHYPMSFLTSDWTLGGSLNAGIPYFWTGYPSIEETMKVGESWVCQSLVGKPAVNSDDITRQFVSRTRKIAVAYDTGNQADLRGVSLDAYRAAKKAMADRFATDVTELCGGGRSVLDQYGVGPNAQADLWLGNGYSDSSAAIDALACMRHTERNTSCPGNDTTAGAQRDSATTILCLLCAFPDTLANAESQASYFPEYAFVSGQISSASAMARISGAKGFRNAFGIREMWQLPEFTNQYWSRAYEGVDPVTTIGPTGLRRYEELMELFAAIQLSGPQLSPAHAASGDTSISETYVGLLGWQRRYNSALALPNAGTPAGGPELDRPSLVLGMNLVRWDPSGIAPGSSVPGCFRILDASQRFFWKADAPHNLDSWASAQFSEAQSMPPPPCSADIDPNSSTPEFF